MDARCMSSVIRAALVAATLLVACSAPAAPQPRSDAPAPNATSADGGAQACTTLADPQSTPPPSVVNALGSPGSGGPTLRGNRVLWGMLPPKGIVPGTGTKIPAVRLGNGAIEAEARRLDGVAPSVHLSFGRGYGDTGFVATGVNFPVAGCWEVTYRHAGEDLRFVLDVRLPRRDQSLTWADGEAELLVALANAGLRVEDVRPGSKLAGFLGAGSSRDLLTDRDWVLVAFYDTPSRPSACESLEGEYVYRFTRGAATGRLYATGPLHAFATDRVLLVAGAGTDLRLALRDAEGRLDQVACGSSAPTSTVIA